jgi:hypothetical protein
MELASDDPGQIRRLLEEGADPNERAGPTMWNGLRCPEVAYELPIVCAIALATAKQGPGWKAVECVKAMVDAGADLSLKNKGQVTPIQWALNFRSHSTGDTAARLDAIIDILKSGQPMPMQDALGPSGTFHGIENVDFYDLRSEEERQIEADAVAGKSLGPALDALIDELLQVCGQSSCVCPYELDQAVADLFQSRDGDGPPWVHKRVREIGKTLADRGGKSSMQAAYYRVLYAYPPQSSSGVDIPSDVSRAWDGLHDWQH